MKKSALFVVAFPFIAPAALRAAEAPQQGAAQGAAQTQSNTDRSWFKNLLTGLQKSAVEGRYHSGRTSAVAAVRGAGQEEVDAKKPHWKGALSDRQAAEFKKEREEFAAAVELILAGKLAEGSAKLDAFEAAHQKSRLLRDVREARQKLEELKKQGAESKPEPKPEQKPEPKPNQK